MLTSTVTNCLTKIGSILVPRKSSSITAHVRWELQQQSQEHRIYLPAIECPKGCFWLPLYRNLARLAMMPIAGGNGEATTARIETEI